MRKDSPPRAQRGGKQPRSFAHTQGCWRLCPAHCVFVLGATQGQSFGDVKAKHKKPLETCAHAQPRERLPKDNSAGLPAALPGARSPGAARVRQAAGLGASLPPKQDVYLPLPGAQNEYK